MAALPPLPQSLKAVQHYIKTAAEHDKRDIVVAYYCKWMLNVLYPVVHFVWFWLYMYCKGWALLTSPKFSSVALQHRHIHVNHFVYTPLDRPSDGEETNEHMNTYLIAETFFSISDFIPLFIWFNLQVDWSYFQCSQQSIILVKYLDALLMKACCVQ